MRLRMLAWGAVLGLLVALFTPMAALAQADTTTIHVSDTETLPTINPCTGAPGTLSGTFKGVIHTTALPDGSFHMTLTTVEELSVVLDDPSQPTYTGKTTFGKAATSTPRTTSSTRRPPTSSSGAPTAPWSPAPRWCMSPCSRTAPPPSSSTGSGCTARNGSADPVGRGA
jgi:hypothetical protein